jgi:uncharacterized protein
MTAQEALTVERRIVYFEKTGPDNTAETLRLARERAGELGVRHLLVASTHGSTALRAAELFQGSGVEVTAVSICAAFDDMGWTMSPAERGRLEARGVRVLTSAHALGDGIAEGFSGENTVGSVVANTLRWFSQGMKVAVEISLMAVEAGLVPPGDELIAVAGTNDGADTAIVIAPAHARKVKELSIREVLCKPRTA